MTSALDRFRITVKASDSDACWWAEFARLTDTLREDAEAAFSLGDYPAEMHDRAARLHVKAEALKDELGRLRRFAAEAAPDRARVKAVKDRAEAVVREWDHQVRRVATFMNDANWRDIGVAG